MIVVTGAAGFIGSNVTGMLNAEGFYDIVPVDDFSSPLREKNLEGKRYTQKVERDELFSWLGKNHRLVQFIVHMGARTDTAETDMKVLQGLNLEYSKKVWDACCEFGLPLIYASSAATYGGGEYGFSDDESLVEKLHPLNPYAVSKNEFDKWVIAQERKPWFWAGLKFFNVYGQGEGHKRRMASVVYHAYRSIMKEGKVRLFRSHKPGYPDGGQKRDFIYIDDVTGVIFNMMEKRGSSGIFNVGTGRARTFLDLAGAVFAAAGRKPVIEFIDIPEDIRDRYQYFTEADTEKLRSAGYGRPFTSLEEGIRKYIREHLDR